MNEERKIRKDIRTAKPFPEISVAIWRVCWISKYFYKIKYFEFNSHAEAYNMMCLFLKNKKCSWIEKDEKVFFICGEHPLWKQTTYDICL